MNIFDPYRIALSDNIKNSYATNSKQFLHYHKHLTVIYMWCLDDVPLYLVIVIVKELGLSQYLILNKTFLYIECTCIE